MLDTLPRGGAAAIGHGCRRGGGAAAAGCRAGRWGRRAVGLALREFRVRLYGCLTARPDALFELCDAILCADHAVTSLVQLSLEAPFTRGHGALYDALAAGGIDEEQFAVLLTATLPPLVDGEDARAWIGGHDVIDYGLLEAALAGLPDERPARCGTRARGGAGCGSRSTRPRTRGRTPSAPRREHVHHDACRCDGARKSIPGWEYQFVAAVGHLRTAWTALIDVERTRQASRTSQTARQVTNLLRRLPRPAAAARGAAGHLRRRVQRRRADRRAGRAARAPAGPAAGQQRLVRRPGHLARQAGPPRQAAPRSPATSETRPANPEPDESLILPDTPQYGTVRVDAWRQVHPLIHGDRGWFADWDGELPVLRGTLLRVLVGHLPGGREPHKTMWLWHAGPPRCPRTSCGAPTWPASTKNTPSGSPRAPWA